MEVLGKSTKFQWQNWAQSETKEKFSNYVLPMEELAATSKLLPSSTNLVIDVTSKVPPKSNKVYESS